MTAKISLSPAAAFCNLYVLDPGALVSAASYSASTASRCRTVFSKFAGECVAFEDLAT
jgi:hypothetical protein